MRGHFAPFPSAKHALYAAPSRESPSLKNARFRQSRCGRIAQLVEQLTLNQRVLGSSPSASTKPSFLAVFCLVLALFAVPRPALAQDQPLALLDQRLASVAERLLTANGALCRRPMPATGMTYLSADQFDLQNRPALFANGDVVIGTIAPGSAAASAGLLRGDTLLAIGEREIAGIAPPEGVKLNEAVFDIVSAHSAAEPLKVTVLRDGEPLVRELTASPACFAFYEITLERRKRARSNGKIIQLSRPLVEEVDDEQLAVIFAHELAHSILEHRTRLSQADVSKGFFGEFGRSRKANRQVEIEADRLTPYLLANAGYDPMIAPAFFRSREGRRLTGNLSFVYPSPSKRAELIEEEIGRHLQPGSGFQCPQHLLDLRDKPFADD